jgi:hypothetical protein
LTCSSMGKCVYEMLDESLLTLAALAGQMVVDAVATDAWETAEHRYAKMLGRGEAKRTQLAEQWLEETREQLARGAGADMEIIRTALWRRTRTPKLSCGALFRRSRQHRLPKSYLRPTMRIARMAM